MMFIQDMLTSIWKYFTSFFYTETVTDDTSFFDAREKIYEDYMSKKAMSELNDICSYIEKKKNIHKDKCRLR